MNTHENILRFLKAVENGQGNEMELWLITDFYERVCIIIDSKLSEIIVNFHLK